jgi:hypothetical protein
MLKMLGAGTAKPAAPMAQIENLRRGGVDHRRQ